MMRKAYAINDELESAAQDTLRRFHRTSEADAARFMMSVGYSVLTAIADGATVVFKKDGKQTKYNPLFRSKQ